MSLAPSFRMEDVYLESFGHFDLNLSDFGYVENPNDAFKVGFDLWNEGVVVKSYDTTADPTVAILGTAQNSVQAGDLRVRLGGDETLQPGVYWAGVRVWPTEGGDPLVILGPTGIQRFQIVVHPPL